jgi:hypothetical protein
MSGNGSYIKSMNGIVSFNTGSTIIEGTGITTDTIDCQTINVVTANVSSTINTSTIYVDFLVPAANAFITMIGDVKYNTNIYIDNIFANLGSTINMNNTIKTTRLDSVDPTATFQVLTAHTGIINIGSDASIVRLGSVTTPVRSAYVAIASTDLCNKTYVDSVSGTGLLSATNVWTGTSNTFNNVVNVNSISAPSGTLGVTGLITTTSNITGDVINSTGGDFQNPTATSACRFARNTTSGTVNLATSQTTGNLNIGTASARTGDINIGGSAGTSTITVTGDLIANDGTTSCTVWGKKTIEFTGGNDYNIVSGDINNIFMVVVNGANPRTIQMPARKIGQIIIIRSIANTGVSNSISVSLISGGNFYNPGLNTTALFYSLPSGGTVSYLDNGSNWISF